MTLSLEKPSAILFEYSPEDSVPTGSSPNGFDPEKLDDSKRTQLTFLQTRLLGHGARMWQLPLTYLGAITVSISADQAKISFPVWTIYLLLYAVGFFFLWCEYGAYEGYERTVRDMNWRETQLGLRPTTKNKISHSLPYFLLIGLGMRFCLIIACYLAFGKALISTWVILLSKAVRLD